MLLHILQKIFATIYEKAKSVKQVTKGLQVSTKD